MFRRLQGGLAGVIAIALALLAPGAMAATDLVQKQGPDGCVTEAGLNGACQTGRGLIDPAGIALSPDGRNAYVAASRDQSVSGVITLSRDPANAALRPTGGTAGCLVEAVSYSYCDSARALEGAEGVAVSPDGRNVYVASAGADALAVFDRDPETGLLTQSATADGCFNRIGDDECAKGRALDGALAVTVSPDGMNVYVASRNPAGGIAVFHRDPESGDLTQLSEEAGCVNEAGAEECADGFAVLTRPEDIEVSPDGKFAYVPSRPGDQIVVFERDAVDGGLTRIPGANGCVNETGIDGCREAKALGDPVALTLDAGGDTLYAAAERDDAIVVFDRDPETGVITEKAGLAGCVSNTGWANPMNADTEEQCQNGIALDGVDSIAVSPDGAALYAASRLSDGLAIFERHADGSLTQRPESSGCITETGYEAPAAFWTQGFCMDGTALRQASDVAVGPDSLQAYSVAREGGVASFDVVPAPSPMPAAEESTAPPLSRPARRNHTACKRVIRKRRATTKALGRALRKQRSLRRSIERTPDDLKLQEKLAAVHRRVKKLRRVRHLARHRERRLCK